MLKKIAAALFLCFAFQLFLPIQQAEAATRYWVGGTGTWDASSTTHWASSSGGSSGASAPTSADVVVFDSSSGCSGATITLSGTAAAASMASPASASCTGATFTGQFYAYGNVTLDTSNTWTGFSIQTQAGLSFDCANTTINNLLMGVNATVTFTNSCSMASMTMNNASLVVTFNGSNYVFNISSYFSISAATSVDFRGTTFNIAGTGTAFQDTSTVNWVSDTTSYINFTDTSSSSVTFAGNGATYGNLRFNRGASTGTNIITGSNTFRTLQDNDGLGTHTLQFDASSTTTVTTWSVSGASGKVLSLRSSSAGTKANLSDSSGTNACDYCDIKDSGAAGGATWNALTGSTNSGNNSGWNFPSSGGGGFMLLGVGP